MSSLGTRRSSAAISKDYYIVCDCIKAQFVAANSGRPNLDACRSEILFCASRLTAIEQKSRHRHVSVPSNNMQGRHAVLILFVVPFSTRSAGRIYIFGFELLTLCARPCFPPPSLFSRKFSEDVDLIMREEALYPYRRK